MLILDKASCVFIRFNKRNFPFHRKKSLKKNICEYYGWSERIYFQNHNCGQWERW